MQKSGLLCTDSSEYQFFSSLPAGNSALTLRLFWLQSQRLNLAENPDVFFLLFQILWTIAVDGTQCFVLNTDRSLQAKHDFVGKTRSILAAFKRKLF